MGISFIVWYGVKVLNALKGLRWGFGGGLSEGRIWARVEKGRNMECL